MPLHFHKSSSATSDFSPLLSGKPQLNFANAPGEFQLWHFLMKPVAIFVAEDHCWKSKIKPMTTPKSEIIINLKTLFMASNGTVSEGYARTFEKEHLNTWIAEGLIEHNSSEKTYVLTPEGENRIK